MEVANTGYLDAESSFTILKIKFTLKPHTIDLLNEATRVTTPVDMWFYVYVYIFHLFSRHAYCVKYIMQREIWAGRVALLQ